MGKKSAEKSVKTSDEEIDLGKLFSLIGNAFSKLFDFIAKLLKDAFHFLILSLIFLKGHLLKLLIAVVLGAFSGFYGDYTSSSKYTYDMIIQPNYRAIDQIYESMEYYNVLIKQRDTIILSEKFDIPYKTAKNLVEFQLISYDTEKDKLLAYDDFIRNTDTVTHENFSYSIFKGDKASKFDSDKYTFRIVSLDNKLKSFEKTIISDVEKNASLQNKIRIAQNILKLDSLAARKAIRDANSLRGFYKEVVLLNAEKSKSATGTHIDFSKESNTNNDIQLFEIVKGLNEKLIETEKEKERSENIVNVITSFNPSGKQVGTLYETKMFRWGVFSGGLVLFFILIKLLNKYLKKYELNNT
ncbi:MAG: hypothetical protein COA67_03645 [Lutibacter sp.]|nr:MAG: hypothetical protein COA67_03645 [Lutibacter sp.]